MKFRKKQTEQRRNESTEYKKQQSYHYSAKRSSSERLYGRVEHINESESKLTNESLKDKFILLPSFVSIILVGIGCIYLLNISPNVKIEIDGSDGFIGDQIAVQSKADEYMRSSVLNRTKLTFDEEKLESKLSADFPEFSSIDVRTIIFRQRPVLTIKFAEPTLLFTNGTYNYLISEQGVVLADITNNKSAVDTTKLTLIQDQTGVPIKLGKVALTTQQVKYILEIVYQTNQKNLKVESLILVPGGGELQARYGGLKYYVKYNLYEDARKSSGTFLATKDNLESKGLIPVEYIDVRIPERAYVK